ncbi:MAG: universal stress protein [Kiritimatiellales bacterium]|nr:universal stress protein [Kiritimatiellales bacterium]MCF7864193.1 universal stress protein [Kiritimatiellales bacterium]
MKTILAAVDFSKNTGAVLEQAAALAKALGAKLWILHVTSAETQAMVYEPSQFGGYAPEFMGLPGDVQLARDLSANEIKREHAQLLGMSSGLRGNGVDAQAILLKGDAAKLVLEKAGELSADIIVLGSQGHGLLHKALLGSVSEAVIRHAACSVMVVPAAN